MIDVLVYWVNDIKNSVNVFRCE